MSIKNRRFELRLSEQELQALDSLVKKSKLEHRAQWLAGAIKKAATRNNCWPDEGPTL
jgi:metal-responsive CopG/Arc/MetJ family transcriptional regulator